MTVQPLKKQQISTELFWTICEYFQLWFVTSTTKEDNPFGFKADAWPVHPIELPSSVGWFINCLLDHGATLFLATNPEGQLVGITIGVVLTEALLSVPAFNLIPVGGNCGDYYFAAFVVCPEHRGHGIGRMMADASIEEAVETVPDTAQMLLRTHQIHPRVVELFRRRGFGIIHEYTYYQFGSATPRVVLGQPISSLRQHVSISRK